MDKQARRSAGSKRSKTVDEADVITEEQAYAVLGLQPGASPLEIKKAYRRHARETHPDTHPDDPSCCGTIPSRPYRL